MTNDVTALAIAAHGNQVKLFRRGFHAFVVVGFGGSILLSQFFRRSARAQIAICACVDGHLITRVVTIAVHVEAIDVGQDAVLRRRVLCRSANRASAMVAASNDNVSIVDERSTNVLTPRRCFLRVQGIFLYGRVGMEV